MGIFNVILKLHLPMIAFIIFLIIVLMSKRSSATGKFTLSFFGLLSTELKINQITAFKIITSTALLILLTCYYMTVDFAQFFPQKLKMTVHFDRKGLIDLYDELGAIEIDGLPIDINDDTTRISYIQASDSTLSEKFKFRNFFSSALIDSTATMTTVGNTTFIVKKTGGLQNYFIERASGELFHSIYEPKKEPTSIKTTFEKTVSSNDKIKFNYISTFFGKKIIISPLFTENLAINTSQGNKEQVELNHFLYGVTAIKVSPIPDYSNTLYLYRTKSKLVPICYAIYIDE